MSKQYFYIYFCRPAVHFLLLFPIFVGVLCLALVFTSLQSVLSSLTIISMKNRESWLFYFNCIYCYVAIRLCVVFLVVALVGLWLWHCLDKQMAH